MKDEPVTWKQVNKIIKAFTILFILVIVLIFIYNLGIKDGPIIPAYIVANIVTIGCTLSFIANIEDTS
jgi:hypothetical protein